jgi:hypothetical protein
MVWLETWLRSKNIVVQYFDIHALSTGSVHAYVYAKKGSYVRFERNPAAWALIADTWVAGQGSPKPPPMPKKDSASVSIKAGETQSFSMALTDTSIRCSNGEVMAQGASLKFIRNNGNKSLFGADLP